MPDAKVILFPVTFQRDKPARRRNLYADGRYCSRVTVTRLDGTKQRKAFYSRKSAEDARRKAREYKALILGGTPAEDIDMTVAQWSERWLPLRAARSPASERIYTRHTKTITTAIGSMRLRDVRKMHLQPILNSAEGMSKGFISQLRMVIKQMFADASDDDLVEKNYAARLISPKGTYTGHRNLEDWERDLILNNWRVRRGAWWMLFIMMTGMRRGEAAARKGGDYDLERQILSVHDSMHWDAKKRAYHGTTKTAAGMREVPIFGVLVDALAEQAIATDAYMCASPEGEALTRQAFDRGWSIALKALEKIANGHDPEKPIPHTLPEGWIKLHWTPHDLRYTYATILYDADVEEKTAQRWMGHTSAEMTRKLYAQLSKRREKQSTDALQMFLTDMQDALTPTKRHQERHQEDDPPSE